MIEPSIAFQTAVRTALVTDPAVSALVPANSVRAGSTRPENLPCIILANPVTQHLGRTACGGYLTRVLINLHIWALEEGADMARQIGGAVSLALWDAPPTAEVGIDAFERPSFSFMRDPDPQLAYCHGVGTVEGAIRWRV
ncbi:hypothetical protein ATO6_12285 [Oceanicola sp. 22II-s10i]|uniref:DUF3168 domain-containing protein n=1 Tax=Oceanicola sp. 22II-s10i TaxID=1317116 RepID=UPI000B51FC93|nr:DUF3168 domain-containing protein [Oceanicola sp. 22II-s10i]OWU84465.1 hypothetical protein ATO6_12285 [Oceanicola sp. 22II-s10i]